MDAFEPSSRELLSPTPIENAPKMPAGRLPVMAFVDAESERALQESAILMALGRSAIMRGGIIKAIEYLSAQRSPNLLIVDISGIDLPLSQMHNLADVCEPGVTVIAIGDRNDVGLYRDLTEAGVADYIVKPVTRELLAKALAPRNSAGELGRATLKLGKMVALIGARGGVGTTTLAVNLAWHLANRQARRVALVDLDLQSGDCTLMLNLKPTPGLRDALANPLRIDTLLLERLMTPYGERLFVLGSEEPLQEDLQLTVSAVDTLFTVLRSQFHYVVVDVPRIPAAPYRRALDVADLRVMVADQTMRSVRDTVRLRTVLGEGGAERRNIIVVNRGGEGGHHALTLKDMSGVLGARPNNVIPFQPTLLAAAANNGQVAAMRRGKFSDAVAVLALELAGRKRSRRRWWGGKK
jgi:pilus assembly protein CpaE